MKLLTLKQLEPFLQFLKEENICRLVERYSVDTFEVDLYKLYIDVLIEDENLSFTPLPISIGQYYGSNKFRMIIEGKEEGTHDYEINRKLINKLNYYLSVVDKLNELLEEI